MSRNEGRPVRLVVVDDSSFVRQAVARMMVDVETIEVVGAAASGEELLSRWDDWNPDVVTLDLSMPGMGGLMTLDQIVARGGPPVIILSTHSGLGAPQTIEALHRGAADFIDKQEYSLLDFSTLGKVLEERVLAVSRGHHREAVEERDLVHRSPEPIRDFEVLVIGASTGGPPAIEQVLVDLGKWCPVPVLVVQHMPVGFIGAFADRLNSRLPLGVFEAQEGARLDPRTVHIGPTGRHLQIVRRAGGLEASLTLRPHDAMHRPSVDVLFQSACDVTGTKTLAVLLTGMGRDGARGMKSLASVGARTLAQDETTCVVFGMPRAAIEIGAVQEVHPLDRIGSRVRDLLAGMDQHS